MESIQEIKVRLEGCDLNQLPEVLAEYGMDSRKGVIRLLKQYAGKYEKLKK